MSKGNKTPAKSNKAKLVQNIMEKRKDKDATENVKIEAIKGAFYSCHSKKTVD
jgi:hypothetical protein